MYLVRGNPFQAHSLKQSFHQKYKCKNNIKLIYLSFIHCTCKFENHKQSFLSENYNRTHHEYARATSTDSIPPRPLLHLCSL